MRTIKTDHIFCLSDLHIVDRKVGPHFACEDTLISFFDSIDDGSPATVLLLGDIFDLWEMKGPPEEKIDRIFASYPQLTSRIQELAKRHHLLLLPGNHDRELTHAPAAREKLRAIGIDIVEEESLMFEMEGEEGVCTRILAEHGHEADPYNNYSHPPHPAEQPLAEQVLRLFILPMKKMRAGKEESWLRDIDNVNPLAAIPWWMGSKYFYIEAGFWVKVLAVPLILIFTLTKVGVVLAILSTLGLNIAKSDMFSPRVYSFLLGFYAVDIFVVFLLIVFWFVRRDIRGTLKRWGVDDFDVVLGRRRRSVEARAEKRLEEMQADIYLFGHTHNELLRKTEHGRIWCNTGTWVKRILRIRAWFYMPSVFVPVYRLTYAKLTNVAGRIRIELRARGQTCPDELNYLERFATLWRKRPVVYDAPDTLIKEIDVGAEMDSKTD